MDGGGRTSSNWVLSFIRVGFERSECSRVADVALLPLP